jgi:hypothetical protein
VLSEDRLVSIGKVKKKVAAARNPELVPRKYLPAEIPPETLKDLKWMMQKGRAIKTNSIFSCSNL